MTDENPGQNLQVPTTDKANPHSDQVELLSLSISDQEYAIDIMQVREIRNWSKPTPLPRTPDYVQGVINLRGTVLPVIDLKKRLGLKEEEDRKRAVYVVVKDAGRLFGVTVDGVSDILTVSKEALLDPPEMTDGEVDSCISGLILEEERMIRVLAPDRLAPENVSSAQGASSEQ